MLGADRRLLGKVVAVVVACTSVAIAGTASWSSASGVMAPRGEAVRPHALTGINELGWSFNGPTAASADGTHVWVVNDNGADVNEFVESTGAYVRTIVTAPIDSSLPVDVASDGSHVWVANEVDQSVAMISASTGAVVKHIKLGQLGVSSGPDALALAGTHVWVALSKGLFGERSGNAVAELRASDGSQVRRLSAATYRFNDPCAISKVGGQIWVANCSGNSITVLSASTGHLVKVLRGTAYGFNEPDSIAVSGSHAWIANFGGNSVTELAAATGSVIAVARSVSYGFKHPSAVATDGTDVWVANASGKSVTELNASTRGLVRVIAGSSTKYPSTTPSIISTVLAA